MQFNQRTQNRNLSIPIENFFKDSDKKIINPNLVDKIALKIAKILANSGLNKNQLRKYYNEIKSLEKMFLLQGEDWEMIEPFVKMVKSKVYYGKGRKMKVDALCEFMEKYIDKINDKDDFKAFCKLFEAVIGYFYGIAKR